MFDGQDITFKISYDPVEQAVRVIWHVKILSSKINNGRVLHIDGISKYFLNWEGFVYRHEVSNLMVNGHKIQPPYIKFYNLSWLQNPDMVPRPI